MNFVKIGKEGGRIVEYAVLPGVTIQDMLNISLITFGLDEAVYVNNIKQTGDWRKEKVLDRSCIIIKREQKKVSVRVARIGESLIPLTFDYGTSLREALRSVNKTPNFDEEVWVHSDTVSKGTLVINIDGIIVDGWIYIVEPKNIVKDKLKNILSAHEGLNTLYSNDCLNEIIKLVKQS